MDPLGTRIRRQRRRLGLTLDELAVRTKISKPYLSLIETGRVTNPPSDEKLRRLEEALGFPTGDLLHQAHLQKTPRDIRAVLAQLARNQGLGAADASQAPVGPPHGNLPKRTQFAANPGKDKALAGQTGQKLEHPEIGLNLDTAYLSGVLHELAERAAGNIEQVRMNAVPIVNRVSAGYPKDFTDLSYPRGVADGFIGCPDLSDPDAFAARVYGDSMRPKYSEGDIVIFSPAAPTRNGDDCFVRFEDGQTTFKRVFFEQDDAGQPILRLQPRNEKYRPQLVPSDRITGVYRAMYRYQTVNNDPPIRGTPDAHASGNPSDAYDTTPHKAPPLQRRSAPTPRRILQAKGG